MPYLRSHKPLEDTKGPKLKKFFEGPDDKDKIAEAVKASSSGTWGYAIYRCTYEDDDEFERLLVLLDSHMRYYFEIFDIYTNLLDSFRWTVFDNRAEFDGASKAFVRNHYDNWTRSSEAGVSESERAKQYPRYRLAIHVDAGVLDAVVHKVPPPGQKQTPAQDWLGYVNLINLDWKHDDPNALDPNFLLTKYSAQKMRKPDKKIITKEDVEEEKGLIPYSYPEIEGCIAWQVGWCKVRVGALASVYAMLLDGIVNWELVYDRPPDVADTDPSLESLKAMRKKELEEAGLV